MPRPQATPVQRAQRNAAVLHAASLASHFLLSESRRPAAAQYRPYGRSAW